MIAKHETALKIILRFIFGFERWHITPLPQRNYAIDIIKYLNSRPVHERSSVLEIGCGLGDILRNLDFESKHGYDAEASVIRAARFISLLKDRRSRTSYQVYSFPEIPMNRRYSSIILVNWIHHVPPKELKTNIEKYFRDLLLDYGEIIVDTVQDKEYKYNHSISYLTQDIHCNLVELGSYERQRQVFVIKRNLEST